MATEDLTIEPNLDSQSDRTEMSSKSSGPRLALITGMLMEKNKPVADESDQDLIFDSDNQKSTASSALSRFGKSGFVTTSVKRTGAFSARSAADRSESSTSVVTDADIRKFVFIHSRGKRFMSGLKVHSLNKQTFLSSFSVGLVLGIVVALLCKLLSEFVFSRTLMISRAL